MGGVGDMNGVHPGDGPEGVDPNGEAQREEGRERHRAASTRWRRSAAGKAWQVRYDAEHREKRAEQRREYKQRPDVIEREAQYRAEHRERILAQKREAERKRQARLAARERANAKKRERYRADPKPAKAKMRAWAEAHPERVQQFKATSRERNRNARNAREREQYATEREKFLSYQREYRARSENKERIAAQKRESERRRRTADREGYNAYQREYRAREKRRRELGLPPRPTHRSTSAEIAANEVAAFQFFAERRKAAQRRELSLEALTVHRAATAPRSEPSREAALREAADLVATAEARARREEARFAAFMTGKEGETLREEVQMDNAARMYFGKGAYPDLHAEVHRRATAVLERDAESDDDADRALGGAEQLRQLRAKHAWRLEEQERRAATGPLTNQAVRAPGAAARRHPHGPAAT
jgi:hypothetical protein